MHEPSSDDLIQWVLDARRRTQALVADLDDVQLLGPRLAIVNPPLWEIGHVAWFQDKWVLRHAAGRPPLRDDGDALYDSAAIPHDDRWDLPLPSRAATLAYLQAACDAVVERLGRGPLSDEERYFVQLTVFHEDMHGEALAYTRQTLGYPTPSWMRLEDGSAADTGGLAGDARVGGGEYRVGANPDDGGFVFDNEKWAHPVRLRPFRIARAAVTQAEFARFVDAGGYQRSELWSPAGWTWRCAHDARHPVYWRRTEGTPTGWERRVFDRWIPLEPHRPMLHVNWYEADAFCRWAGRRLPTEAEWEVAASTLPGDARRRRYPWGDAAPTAERAQLGGLSAVAAPVAACAAGESGWGCRGMLGGAWEWCSDDFLPYPGFVADPYKEYSAPWFGTHKVLRGGCFVTQPRLLRNTWRNFYTPDRRDVWAGFRTCALDA
ncbi:MAG TPA: selenoneine synthase SenA [Polyangia bacterium]|nr:selenoneine synthase SenA [Polyangia bacterium]